MAESIEALIERARGAGDAPPTIARLRAATDPREREILERAMGDANEARLLRVLTSGELPPWILSVRKGTWEEDRRGADLVATVRAGREIAIQVKSSAREAMRFVEQGRRRNGDGRWRAALVVVREGEPDETLRARSVHLIGKVVFGPSFSSHR